MAVLQMWADLHCPYAYLAAWRLRKVLPEVGGVVVEHRSLAIEHADEKVTPKPVLDAETPLVLAEEPDVPYRPWPQPDHAWPVTMWPAFEAVRCARRQGWEAAHELDWRLRRAFFGEGRCVSMRHVLLDVARGVPGLDLRRLEEDWDAGIAKREVVEDAREGWDRMGLRLSPTFVLPSGERVENPAAPTVHLDEARGHAVARVDPPSARGEAALDEYRAMLRRALAA